MQYAATYIMYRVKIYLYINCRKAFGEYCDIQIKSRNDT